MTAKTIALAVALGISLGPANAHDAPEPTAPAIDEYLTNALESTGVPGFSVVVTKGDGVVHAGRRGRARRRLRPRLGGCGSSELRMRSTSSCGTRPPMPGRATRRNAARDRAATLNLREREVPALVGAGLSNQDVAQRLFLAEGSVKAHVRTIVQRLSAKNRVQAAITAYEAGLVGG
ncbi:response regulator transcription factor [Saccharopolyspora hattusasensis]|uniref:response regulator transcription factor n=1 Tax=Saccharopolyspora hattusasensis TaxID=1128679 RepID=UPI003D976DF3